MNAPASPSANTRPSVPSVVPGRRKRAGENSPETPSRSPNGRTIASRARVAAARVA